MEATYIKTKKSPQNRNNDNLTKINDHVLRN